MWKRFLSFLTIPFTDNKNNNISFKDMNHTLLQIEQEPENSKNEEVVYIITKTDKDHCGICYYPIGDNCIKINCHQFHKDCIKSGIEINWCKHCNNAITSSPKNGLKR